MKTVHRIIKVTAIAMTLLSCQHHEPADMIITNARIWTCDRANPSATAMAVTGDTIVAVGSDREVMKYAGSGTVVTDMKGNFIIPGFIDSHVHFLQGGLNLTSVQLRDAATPAEFISRIGAYAATLKPGTWILGGDWDGKGWENLPDRSWIDSVTPDNPVFVSRLDGHMGLANSLAMKLAGVSEATRDISGGMIGRSSSGEPTGIFKDNSMSLIFSSIPPPSPEETENALAAAMDYFASNGITSVQAVDGSDYIDAINRLRDDNRLKTRIYWMTPVYYWKRAAEQIRVNGLGDKWVKTGAVKGFVDGSLGSHTAAFMEPYTDLRSDSGFFVNSQEDLMKWIREADSAGLQNVIHAIGDRAINFLLDACEKTGEVNGQRDRRFRIEHAQHILPSDIGRFAGLGVIASMQPYHAIDDGRWAEKYIGPERIKTTYAFRSLLDSGAALAFGSDWPVAPATPLEGIYAAVTRRTLDESNPDGWVPEQKITAEEALRAYTLDAAFASFDEGIKGTLEPGKLADFTVLDTDILSSDPVMIRGAKVLETWVGGKIVFKNTPVK